MKFTSSVVCILLFLVLSSFGQSSLPAPAGMRQAQKFELQNERELSPPKPSRAAVKPEQLRDEADELVNLAAWVRTGVNDANKGLLDKDLLQKLKQLEKLSKRLRDHLNR
ncbi:MAG TPA: hypothetical protein VKQ11_00835 [Candidatus Sulfotelmatobacter sp.]|nr:hypothetical protein [Candidatus Sulfotelmatobacter sp.]